MGSGFSLPLIQLPAIYPTGYQEFPDKADQSTICSLTRGQHLAESMHTFTKVLPS
jgi:hypothetical protein